MRQSSVSACSVNTDMPPPHCDVEKLRALRHVFNMRCAPEAEEEILMVATMMLKEMMNAEPNFYGDFVPEAKTGCYRPKYPKI